MEPHRRPQSPYREPPRWPEAEYALLTCEEMRAAGGPWEAFFFAIAVGWIAWTIVGN